MYIYIYGREKFKKEVNSLLEYASINANIENIKSVMVLEDTIKDNPQEIFLIDSEKIIEDDLFIEKFNFLKPKDAIKKSFLDKYGVGDICFNSMKGLVDYICSRIPKEIESNNLEENEEIEYNEDENNEIRDRSNILLIDDIYEHEMDDAMIDHEVIEEINNSGETNG